MPDPATPSDERSKVGMLIPPPFLLIGLVLACVAAQWLWLGGFSFAPGRVALGGVLTAGAIALIAVCGKLFQKAGTPVRPVAPTTTIVKTGVYGLSRNPMYLGMAALLAGLGVLSGSYCFVPALAVFLAVVHFGVVLPEERYLEALHGEPYRQYKQEVRRWV